MRKLKNSELGRISVDNFKLSQKTPIIVVLDNVRSAFNVGSIFRSADGFGACKIYLSGFTAYPPRVDLSKTALGAENSVPWEHFKNPIDAAEHILKNGQELVLLEQTIKSKSLYDLDYPFPLCFIVGNEVNGVSEELANLATIHVEIPMRGIKQSLNVSVATGVAGYEFSRLYSSFKK